MAGKGSAYSVDIHPQKDAIVKRFMAGHSLRAVGEGLIPPISQMALHRYKVNVIKPILRRAEATERIVLGEPEVKQALIPLTDSPSAVKLATQAIKDAPVVSIWREKVNALIGRTERTLDKAEAAVRMQRDEDGNEVFAAPDLAVMAPLINAGWKGLEILGRATGELEPQGGTGISIQIVLPRSSGGAGQPDAEPRISYASADTIEIEPESDAVVEIGLLQKP